MARSTQVSFGLSNVLLVDSESSGGYPSLPKTKGKAQKGQGFPINMGKVDSE